MSKKICIDCGKYFVGQKDTCIKCTPEETVKKKSWWQRYVDWLFN